MIIGLTNDKCEIGEIVCGEYQLTENTIVIATFKILRKATYEEWKNYRESVGRPIFHDKKPNNSYYFYEVHTD